MNRINLIICFCGILFGQNLEQVLTDALETHPLLKAAAEKENAIKESAKFSASLADAKLAVIYFPEPIVTANGPQEAVVQISQSFPFFGTLSLKEAIGIAEARSVNADQAMLRNQLEFQISVAYFRLAAAQEQLQLVNDYKKLLNSFYQSALTKYEQSLGSQQTVLKAQTEIVRIEDQQLDLQLMIVSYLKRLNEVAHTTYNRLDANFQEVMIDADSVAINQLPAQQSLRYKQNAVNSELDLIAKEKLPDFQLGLQYSLIKERNGISGNQDAIGIQFAMSLPFLSGKYGEKEAAVSAKKMMLAEQYTYNFSASRQRIDEIRQRIKYLDQRLQLYETDLITKAELTLSSSLASYETGELDFLNVLDAERLLLEVRKQAIEIKLKQAIAKAEFKNETTVYRSGDSND
ncbi:MAG: TolC family protein [Calditrichaeota bacterium]|nr:TolC family protein [Calditrichota bacterium]